MRNGEKRMIYPINTANATGRLGNDPTPQKTKTGTTYVRFDIAIADGKTETGEDSTQWITVKAYGKTADIIATYHKGDLIAVLGKNRKDKWKQDNATRTEQYILAETVVRLEKARRKTETEYDGFDTGTPVEITEDELPF